MAVPGPSPSSFWAFLLSWITPTSLSLFLYLNLVIGTIILSHRFGTHKNPPHHHDQLESSSPPRLVRTPSLLDRVRSINFSHYLYEQHNSEPETLRPAGHEHMAAEHADLDIPIGLTRSPSFLERIRSFNFSHYVLEQANPESEALRPAEHQHMAVEHADPYMPIRLTRTPSLLEQVRSFNFSHCVFEQHNPEAVALRSTEHMALEHGDPHSPARLTRTPSLLERLKSMDFPFYEQGQPEPSGSEHEARDPSPNPTHENLVHRSKSDSDGGARAKRKMKKSVSQKVPSRGEDDEDKEVVEKRRPATVKVEKTLSFGGDEEVDAKADDFINRFKQQLKLQRMDSLLRYKEMLKRN